MIGPMYAIPSAIICYCDFKKNLKEEKVFKKNIILAFEA